MRVHGRTPSLILSSSLLIFIATLLGCSGPTPRHAAPVANPPIATFDSCSDGRPHKGAVLAGDYPDPSVIKVGDEYWATATSSSWAPAYPLLKSKDLVNWTRTGAVFKTPPAWSKGDYWAPEIKEMDGKYFVYFTARNRTNDRLCIGVATSTSVAGPYKDHGPMICQPVGSIDPAPVVGDDGKKYLFWKEDGNSQGKPTPIHMQRLSDDGTQLVGEMTDVIRNDAAWEGHLVEGPFVMKHGDYWYLFYSGNACCGVACNYAVGVARAKSLEGPWEKDAANPILKGNEQWRCPGHGSIVGDGNGHDVFLYHAYNAKDSIYVGRQQMADVIDWGSDGWPSINAGTGPSTHPDGFLGAKLANFEHVFKDEFNSETLSPDWQWPASRAPLVTVDKSNQGLLVLSVNGTKARSADPIGTIVARGITVGDYTATAVVGVRTLKGDASAGLSVFGNLNNALGISVSENQISVWRRRNGQHEVLKSDPIVFTGPVSLRIEAKSGTQIRFSSSTDGITWNQVGTELNGADVPPWDLGMRVALVAGGSPGSVAEFESIDIEPAKELCQ